MKPISFPEQHGELKAPAGQEESVVRLPVWVGDDLMVSCWRMSWRERLSALVFGRCWLSVMGSGHPPVALDVRRNNFDPAPVETWMEHSSKAPA